MNEYPPHATTQAALGTVKAGVIRNAIQENVQVNAMGIIPPFSFQPPGGVSGWKRVRISNYSPYLFQVIGVPGGGSGDPPELLLPFQQNVWNYEASRGTITLKGAMEGSPLAIPPVRFAYGAGTAEGDLLFNYVTVEWTDTPDLFFGYYPVTLEGVCISAEAVRLGGPLPAVIPVGTTPVAVAFDQGSGGGGGRAPGSPARVYVANGGSHSVTVIDPVTLTVVTTIDVVNPPTDLAVETSTGRLYVARSGINDVLMLQNNIPVGSVPVGAAQTGICCDPVTHKKYVSLAVGNKVAVLSATDVHTGDIVVGVGPRGIAANKTTGQVYVALSTANTVRQINEATDLVVGIPIVVGTTPLDVAVDSVLNQVYVANSATNNVSNIDGATALVTATIAVGADPIGITINEDTSRVYVVNQNVNSVSVILEGANVIVGTLAPGVGPTDVAVDPSTNLVYVPIAANALVVLQGV